MGFLDRILNTRNGKLWKVQFVELTINYGFNR